jgi:CMP-N,N'-diacetyllegionaminic acid synthase
MVIPASHLSTLPPSQAALGEVAGLILSRKGSQRLPNKAWCPLAGRPLLAYTLLAAQHSQTLSVTTLYTDDTAWRPWAEAFGIAWPSAPRPTHQSQAVTSSLATLQHWLRTAAQHHDNHHSAAPTWLALLQPTSPLRTAQQLDAALLALAQALAQGACVDGVVSVAPLAKPLAWLQYQPLQHPGLTQGALPPLQPLAGCGLALPEAAQWYWPSGAFYVLRSTHWLSLDPQRSLFDQGIRWLAEALPWWACVDVDTAADLEQAEAALAAAQRQGSWLGHWPEGLPALPTLGVS